MCSFKMDLILHWYKKEVDNDVFSSVLWVSLSIACVLYVFLFISAPLTARFHDLPNFVDPLC